MFYILEFRMKVYCLFSHVLYFNNLVYAMNMLPERNITYTVTSDKTLDSGITTSVFLILVQCTIPYTKSKMQTLLIAAAICLIA